MQGPKSTIAARFARISNAAAFRTLLLLIFTLLFCWPYLSFVEHATMGSMFVFLFGVWALLIGALMVISAAKEQSNDIKNNG